MWNIPVYEINCGNNYSTFGIISHKKMKKISFFHDYLLHETKISLHY